MRGDTFVAIARVSRVFHVQAPLPRNVVSIYRSEQFSGFAREHGPKDDLDEATKVGLVVLRDGQAIVNRQIFVLVKLVDRARATLQPQFIDRDKFGRVKVGVNEVHVRLILLFVGRVQIIGLQIFALHLSFCVSVFLDRFSQLFVC